MQQDGTRHIFSILGKYGGEEEWMTPMVIILFMMSFVLGLFVFNYSKKRIGTRRQQEEIETLTYSSSLEEWEEVEEILENQELIENVLSTQFRKEDYENSYSESSTNDEIKEQPEMKEQLNVSASRNTEKETVTTTQPKTSIEETINHNRRLLLQQLQNPSSNQTVIGSSSSSHRKEEHLLSTHSFLMVCSKCNNLFATFIPPKQDLSLKDPVFPERFKTHPFTFGVLLGDNKRRNVAFTPRFADESEGEQLFIPTLCNPDSKYLIDEFDCRKIQESDLAEMKDKCKMARDMGKLLRLFCKNCGTKVGSILKEPLELSVTEDIKLPFNTFMDQQDCSIVEKCHCHHSESVGMSAHINSENIVNVSDPSTFRKVSLGEWKYSSLASMLFDMAETPEKQPMNYHNRNSNKNRNYDSRGKYPPRKFNNNQPHNNNRRNNQRPKVQQPRNEPTTKTQKEETVPKKKKKRKKKSSNNEPEGKKVKVENTPPVPQN